MSGGDRMKLRMPSSGNVGWSGSDNTKGHHFKDTYINCFPGKLGTAMLGEERREER